MSSNPDGDPSHDLTDLLTDWARGDRNAGDRLLEVVYKDLHAMAVRYLQGERRSITWQPTALVHETYLRLVDQHCSSWKNRSQFFCIASKTMRRILVDHARGRLTNKRGGDWIEVPLEEAEICFEGSSTQMVALDEALESLAATDPLKAKIVELRFFGGLQFQEIALHLEISSATLNRHWRLARRWLYNHLVNEAPSSAARPPVPRSGGR